MIHKYTNGNYNVEIDDVTGTKVRYTEDNEFISKFPESIDCTITYKCSNNVCEFCYAGCTENGKHADLDSDYVNNVFIPSLHPYTELALNGNDLTHPQLIDFLTKLKSHNILANLTVNQKHFMQNLDLLHDLYNKNLVHGIGVSLVSPSKEFIDEIQKFPTAVIHVIAGILSMEDIKALRYHDLKILILGYKRKGRGNNYYVTNAEVINSNIEYLKQILPYLIQQKAFSIISFDNLAIEQLAIMLMLSEERWNEFFMGRDGDFSMNIDLVNMVYSVSSITKEVKSINFKDVVQMFQDVRRDTV